MEWKTAQHFLFKEFDPSYEEYPTIQDLQLAITLNPSLEKIERAMQAYAKQFAPVWVPVWKRLPEQRTDEFEFIRVLTYTKSGEYVVMQYSYITQQFFCNGVDKTYSVTHWQPLPQTPEKD